MITAGPLPDDRIDAMTLFDWPDGATPPTIDRLTVEPSRDLIFIRELSVIAGLDEVQDVVLAAVAEATASAFTVNIGPVGAVPAVPAVPTVPASVEAVRFVDDVHALGVWLLDSLGGRRLPAWLAAQIADTFSDGGTRSAVDVLVHWPGPMLQPLVVLRAWGVLAEVLDELPEVRVDDMARRLLSERGLTIDHDGESGSGRPTGATIVVPGTVEVGRSGSWAPGQGRPIVDAVVERFGPTPGRAGLGSASPENRSAPEAERTADEAERDVALSVTAPGRTTEPEAGGAVAAGDEGVGGEVLGSEPPAGWSDDEPAEPFSSAGPSVRSHADAGDQRGDEAQPDPPVVVDHRTVSGLAGVLYLVNPLLAIDVGDHGIADVSPWELLSGVARRLLAEPIAEAGPAIDEDPLWDLLAGWASADVGARGATPLADGVVDAVAGAARDRLVRRPGEHELGQLLLVPGVVAERDVHVDVHFASDAANVVIRRNGFDVDPGWVPGLGRVIRFHYGDRP